MKTQICVCKTCRAKGKPQSQTKFYPSRRGRNGTYCKHCQTQTNRRNRYDDSFEPIYERMLRRVLQKEKERR